MINSPVGCPASLASCGTSANSTSKLLSCNAVYMFTTASDTFRGARLSETWHRYIGTASMLAHRQRFCQPVRIARSSRASSVAVKPLERYSHMIPSLLYCFCCLLYAVQLTCSPLFMLGCGPTGSPIRPATSAKLVKWKHHRGMFTTTVPTTFQKATIGRSWGYRCSAQAFHIL